MMEASLIIWLHLVAAVSWIGGMVFLSVVLVPILKREPFASQKTLPFLAMTRRFRVVVWGVIAVLLFTGPLLMHQRGIPIADPSRWPTTLAVKLGLVTILLLLTLAHDLIIGPRVGRIVQLPTESRTSFDHALVLWSRWVARFSLLLALAVLFAAVMLARS
jgi:copper resistance protein D